MPCFEFVQEAFKEAPKGYQVESGLRRTQTLGWHHFAFVTGENCFAPRHFCLHLRVAATVRYCIP
jgi:hypothetical protein